VEAVDFRAGQNFGEAQVKIDQFVTSACRIMQNGQEANSQTGTSCPLLYGFPGPGEKCELSTGQPRTEPHRDRRLMTADRVKKIRSVVEMEKGVVNLRRRMICYLLSMLKRHSADCEKCNPGERCRGENMRKRLQDLQ